MLFADFSLAPSPLHGGGKSVVHFPAVFSLVGHSATTTNSASRTSWRTENIDFFPAQLEPGIMTLNPFREPLDTILFKIKLHGIIDCLFPNSLFTSQMLYLGMGRLLKI